MIDRGWQGFIFGLFAGLMLAAVLWFSYQGYEDSQHFQLHYTGVPFNPTCHLTGPDQWDCEHIR
jgi:hypothetical protein